MSRTLDILADFHAMPSVARSCPTIKLRSFAHVCGKSLLEPANEHEKLVSVRRRSEIKYNLKF